MASTGGDEYSVLLGKYSKVLINLLYYVFYIMSHYAKYLKYKNKYLSLKKDGQKGGFNCNHEIGYKNILGTCWMVAIQMIFSFGSISGRLLEKNIKKMSIKYMIRMGKSLPNIEKILPGVLESSKSVYLEAILTTFVKRYRSKLKLPYMNKTVKPLDLPDKENKERCELVIAENFKEMFDGFCNADDLGGYISDEYLFSNLLSIFFLGRKTSFINYYAHHNNPNKKISNIKYNNHENYGICIEIKGHVCCFFTCMKVEKYYNDNDGKIYPCDWKELLKKTTDTRCLYVQEKGCILLLYNEEYINRPDKSMLKKVESLVVLSTDQNTNSFDNDIQNYMNKSYEKLLKPETELSILEIPDVRTHFESTDNEFEYYKILADQGKEYFQNKLGNIYKEQGNIEASIKYHTMASDQGNDFSQYHLGNIYKEHGNIQESIKYHTMASDQGYEDSQYELGNIYEKQGNIDEAIKYYTMASDQGHNNSQYHLGKIYEERKKAKDEHSQLKYIVMAEDQNQNSLGMIYQDTLNKCFNGNKEIKYCEMYPDQGSKYY